MIDDEPYNILCILLTFSPWLALTEVDGNGGGRVGMVTPVGPVVFEIPPPHWPLFDWIRRTHEPFPEVSREQTRARLREIATEFVRRLAVMKAAHDAGLPANDSEPS